MVIGSITITIFGIIAILVIVLMAAAVCYFCMRTNAQIDERRERREEQAYQEDKRRKEQAYQEDRMIKQIQLCKEMGVPVMLNHQMPQHQMPVYSENIRQTPAYSVKLLGR